MIKKTEGLSCVCAIVRPDVSLIVNRGIKKMT